MAQESPKNSAAEIPVTSNGQLEDSHEHSFNRDLKHSLPVGLGLSETKITSHGFDSTKEGVVEAGPFPGKGNCFLCLLNLKSSGIFSYGQVYNVL
uniref:ADP ribosylation factor interacting protein 1 n=1 Tax=Accipiter nisus TaxID=211598 RepID=A0A8B9RW77_9AVES